jgi:hypothetical protein
MAIWAATGLTGGTSGDLDNISVSALSDGDRAIVIASDDVYHYVYNESSGQSESSPDVVVPDDATGDEAWELVSSGFSGSHNDLTDVSSDDHHTRYTDSEAANAAPVQEVAGKTGSVSLDKSDVGLGNVPNEDATDMANWDQKSASSGQAPLWDGSQWSPSDVATDAPVTEEKYLELIMDIAENRYEVGLSQENYDDVFYDVFANSDKVSSTTQINLTTGTESFAEIEIEIDDTYVYTQNRGNLYKLDSDGNEVWGYAEHNNDVTAITADSNGYVYSGDMDNEIHKIDIDGNNVWKNTYNSDTILSLALDSNGNVYAASDCYLRKFDSDGNYVWSYYAGSYNYIYSIAVDIDGYIYAGTSKDEVHKIDSNGDNVWTYTEHSGDVNGVAVDSDGNVYSASDDNEVHKIDSNGNNVWKYTEHTDYVNSVEVDSNKNVYSGSRDTEVHKIDSNGNNVWKYTEHSGDVNAVTVDSDGYVYSASNDEEVHKIDSSGNNVWKNTEQYNDGVEAVATAYIFQYYSSGTINSTTKSLDFTPSKVIFTQEVELPSSTDIIYTISDNSGNSVAVSQSEVGDEIDLSSFQDGDIDIEITLETTDDKYTPTIYEYGTYFV